MTNKRLVLHVGLPKTGTTALQRWCYVNRHALRQYGIHFPDEVESERDPKHQFLVHDLLEERVARLAAVLASSDCSVLALSSEGLTNQLHRFSDRALEAFRHVTASRTVVVFITTRRFEDWIKSYYRQCLVNPAVDGFPYATTSSLFEFHEDAHVQRLKTHIEAPERCGVRYGAHDLVVAQYEGDWFGAWKTVLGLNDDHELRPLGNANESLSETATRVALEINRAGFDRGCRETAMALLARCAHTSSTVMVGYRSRTDEHGAELRAFFSRLRSNGELDALLIDKLILATGEETKQI